VSRLSHIHIEIVVGQYRASRGWDADGNFSSPHLLDYLRHDPVKEAVTTSRAIVKHVGLEQFGSTKNLLHLDNLLLKELP
jgi:hypothetical protein